MFKTYSTSILSLGKDTNDRPTVVSSCRNRDPLYNLNLFTVGAWQAILSHLGK